jgi:hypothetical protein
MIQMVEEDRLDTVVTGHAQQAQPRPPAPTTLRPHNVVVLHVMMVMVVMAAVVMMVVKTVVMVNVMMLMLLLLLMQLLLLALHDSAGHAAPGSENNAGG